MKKSTNFSPKKTRSYKINPFMKNQQIHKKINRFMKNQQTHEISTNS